MNDNGEDLVVVRVTAVRHEDKVMITSSSSAHPDGDVTLAITNDHHLYGDLLEVADQIRRG